MPAIYTVVTIDGQEHSNIDLDTIKQWFFERKLREDSFVMSSEYGQWKILKKEFDLNQWTTNKQHSSWQSQPQQTAQWNNGQQYTPQYSQPVPQQNWTHSQHQETNPYQTPQQQAWVSQNNWAPPPPPSSPKPVFFGTFESGSSRAAWAANSMKIVLVFTGLLILVNILTVISPPNAQSFERGQIDGSFVGLLVIAGLVGLGFFAALIVTIILYLMWLHRAYRNLQALGHQTDYSPGWAVGYWFIPIINLVKPYKIVNELYEKTDSQGSKSPTIVGVWWLTYILSGLIGWAANIMTSRVNTPDVIATAAMVDIVSSVLSIIAGWVCINIINAVDEMQEEQAGASQHGYAVHSQMGYQTNYYQ